MASIAQPDASSAAIVAGASRELGEQEAALRNRRLALSIATALAFEGFTMSINGIGSPWIAKSFHLGESGIAGLLAWISVSAIGALGLSRMIDRLGRRRMLLVCMAGTTVSALAVAFSTNVVAFVLCEIVLYAFIGAAIAGGIVILAEELAIEERARGQSLGGLGMGLGGGLCLVMMPMVASRHSWRWMLVLASAMGVAALWRAARVIPESGRWQHAAATGTTSASSFYDVFGQALSTPRDHDSGLLVAGHHRSGRGQQLGVFPPGLGRGVGAGRCQRPDAGRRRCRTARLSARRAKLRALRPHPHDRRCEPDDRPWRARLLLGSSGALGPSLAMDRGHVLRFHCLA